MPKGPQGQRRPVSSIQTAVRVGQIATKQATEEHLQDRPSVVYDPTHEPVTNATPSPDCLLADGGHEPVRDGEGGGGVDQHG